MNDANNTAATLAPTFDPAFEPTRDDLITVRSLLTQAALIARDCCLTAEGAVTCDGGMLKLSSPVDPNVWVGLHRGVVYLSCEDTRDLELSRRLAKRLADWVDNARIWQKG